MRQALELALEALEDYVEEYGPHEKDSGAAYAITAIKEALAQPEQEPVAYINIEERKLEWAYKYMSWDTPTVVNLPKIPLYTTPPQRTWVGLTDEDITELHYEIKVRLMGTYKTEDIYRAIEAKLKEKNNG